MKKNLAKHITLGIMVGTMLMGSSAAYAYVPSGTVGQSDALAAGNASAMAENSIVISVGDGTGDIYNSSQAFAEAANSVVIGAGSSAGAENGSQYNPTGSNSVVIGADSHVNSYNNVAVGAGIDAMTGSNNVILGYGSSTGGAVSDVVSVGSGVAPANTTDPTLAPQYRRIINVADGVNAHDAVTKGQLDAALANVSGGNVDLSDYAKTADVNTALADKANAAEVNTALAGKANAADVYTKTESDGRYVQISSNTAGNNQPNISIDSEGQMVFGTTSSWIGGNGEGFFAGTIDPNQGHTAANAKASMTEDGNIKGINVTAENFILKGANNTSINVGDALDAKANAAEVNTALANKADTSYVNAQLATKADAATTLGGYGITDAYTKTETDDKLSAKANAADVYTKTEVYNKTETDSKLDGKADKATTLEGYGITDAYTKNDIDGMIGSNTAAVSGLNQRIDSLDGRLDEVGAGAAALAALHPLDYDPENKLSFAAGVGRYQGATASAIGAFYRPNEDVMLSLGGTAGNGENMVNLGVSFAIGKGSSGLAKMSKLELIDKVQTMENKYEAVNADNKELRQEINHVKAENQNLKEELAMMKVMLQEIAAKI